MLKRSVDQLIDALPDDAALVERIGRHDEEAFCVLYDRYADLVFSVALRVLADEGAAQDIAQDVFVRLWQRSEKFDSSRGRFMPWLLSVTRNRAVDEVRSRGRRRVHEAVPVEGSEDPVDTRAEDPASAAVHAAERREVRSALQSLPDEQRRPIELAYFGGMTQQEIAAHLAAPLGTVKTRMRLGMRKLRSALGRELGAAGIR